MTGSTAFPLITVDIGNNRIKLGLFPSIGPGPLPEPSRTLSIPGSPPCLEAIDGWLAAARHEFSWWIGSVNRPWTTRVLDWLGGPGRSRATLLAAADLPLRVGLPRPDMVGIDRLLDAVAANRLRLPGRAAVIADIGSAITVDLVSADGVYRGGAIAPGIAMSARALHEFTDLLPALDMSELEAPPPALGTSTQSAIRSGLFWGAVGTIRELVERLAEHQPGAAQVFLTGGAGPAVAGLLGPHTQHVPHLTLAGIALAAVRSRSIAP
jgi:type III pantothenate kinase